MHIFIPNFCTHSFQLDDSCCKSPFLSLCPFCMTMTECRVACMGVGRGGMGGQAPLDFEIISKKRLFFQFRRVKTKFHNFCPPLEKILPTPMVAGALFQCSFHFCIDYVYHVTPTL